MGDLFFLRLKILLVTNNHLIFSDHFFNVPAAKENVANVDDEAIRNREMMRSSELEEIIVNQAPNDSTQYVLTLYVFLIKLEVDLAIVITVTVSIFCVSS